MEEGEGLSKVLSSRQNTTKAKCKRGGFGAAAWQVLQSDNIPVILILPLRANNRLLGLTSLQQNRRRVSREGATCAIFSSVSVAVVSVSILLCPIVA